MFHLEGYTLLVENIPFHCNEQMLLDIFQIFGPVQNVEIKLPVEKMLLNGPNTLQAFVTFSSQYVAENALKYSNGRTLHGNILRYALLS